jgi:hypothetical protein
VTHDIRRGSVGQTSSEIAGGGAPRVMVIVQRRVRE